MSSASRSDDGDVLLSLSRDEALVLFEWLARNWEKTNWRQSELFSDGAERKLLVSIEGELAQLMGEAFAEDYQDVIGKAWRSILPVKEEGA